MWPGLPLRRANVYKALLPENRKMMQMADDRKNHAGSNGNGCLDEQLSLFVAEEASLNRHLDEMSKLADDGALGLTRSERTDVERRSEIIEHLATIRWFSLAAVHLYDLRMPRSLPQDLQRRLKVLQRRCLRGSFPPSLNASPSKGDIEWAVKEAKELRRLLDNWRRAASARNGPRQRVAE